MAGMYGGKNFDVKVTDKLTDEEMTLTLTQTFKLRTQEDAEVQVYVSPTPFQNHHPGFDIEPKDPAKFKAALDKWVKDNPAKALALLDRDNWVSENPEEAEELRRRIKAADAEGARAAAVVNKV